MNAGEVENPGAFDSEEKTAKTTPVGEGKNPPEPSQMIDPDEPIGDDGVNYDVYADGPEANGTVAANDTNLEFSAEDIRNRKKTNYFVNIKDADKLERAAERKHDADSKRILAEQRRAEKEAARAEKAAAAERARQQKYNDEQEKTAHKEIVAEEKHQRKIAAAERRRQSRKLAAERFRKGIKKFFTNKRNLIIMSCVAVVLIGAVALQINWIINVLPQKQAIEAEEKVTLSALEVNKEAVKLYNSDGYDAANKYFVEIIDSYSSENSSYNYDEMSKIVLYHADFIINHKKPSVSQEAGTEEYTLPAEDALIAINSFDFNNASFTTKCHLYETQQRIYGELGNFEKSDEYMELINKECEVDDGPKD